MSRRKLQETRLKLRNVTVSCLGALLALGAAHRFLHQAEATQDIRHMYASTAFSFLVLLFTIHIRNIVKSL